MNWIIGILGIILALFILGWALARTTKVVKPAKRPKFAHKAKSEMSSHEKEAMMDEFLRTTGTHLKERTRFEQSLINAKKKLWIGRDGKRVHSRKAFLTAKRIADIVDDQAGLWKSLKKVKSHGKDTRFEANNEELEKRRVQLRFFILELVRDIQEEEQVTKHALTIDKKHDFEVRLRDAKKSVEIKKLEKELDIELRKFREYNLSAQSGRKLLDFNRVIMSKAKELGLIMINLLKHHIKENEWTGSGKENAQQTAHHIAFFCKKIDDDVLAKTVIAKTIRR